MWDECDQNCVNTNNSYTCSCKANYTLIGDGHCQHSTSYLAKVLFSIGSKIYETDKNGQNFRVIFDHNDFDISNFDYNYQTKSFYLTDEKTNKVT